MPLASLEKILLQSLADNPLREVPFNLSLVIQIELLFNQHTEQEK